MFILSVFAICGMAHLRNLQICYLRINEKKFKALEFADAYLRKLRICIFRTLKKTFVRPPLLTSLSIRNISSFFFKEQKMTIKIVFISDFLLLSLIACLFCSLFFGSSLFCRRIFKFGTVIDVL
jgi:hypothetical protein